MKKIVCIVSVLVCVSLTACSMSNSPVGFVLDLFSKETEPEIVETVPEETYTVEESYEEPAPETQPDVQQSVAGYTTYYKEALFSDDVITNVLLRHPEAGKFVEGWNVVHRELIGDGLCSIVVDTGISVETIVYEPITGSVYEEGSVSVTMPDKLNSESMRLCLAAYGLRHGYKNVELLAAASTDMYISGDNHRVSVNVLTNPDSTGLYIGDNYLQIPREVYYRLRVEEYYTEHGFGDKLNEIEITYEKSNGGYMMGKVVRNGVAWCICVDYSNALFSGKYDVKYADGLKESYLVTESVRAWSAYTGNREDIEVVNATTDTVELRVGGSEAVSLQRVTGLIDGAEPLDSLICRYEIAWHCDYEEHIGAYIDYAMDVDTFTGVVSVEAVPWGDKTVYTMNTDLDSVYLLCENDAVRTLNQEEIDTLP